MKKLKGFTLIEMMVVVAIMAVLAGVSLFALENSRQAARDARRKADLEAVRSALELYRADCNAYPASLSLDGTTDLQGTVANCGAVNTYYVDLPKDSDTTRSYLYTRLTAQTYELCTALETLTTAVATGCSGGCGGTCSYRVLNP
jgi:general secretion pathway protein G